MHLKAYANHLSGAQVMAIIIIVFLTFKSLLQAENSVTGRAYMGEALVQVWLKSIKE